jgi:3-hydroxyisobutyrate dehydrogenase-like beta-hydroxyacid dehydrogenase
LLHHRCGGARQAADILRLGGVGFSDCPVSGGVEGARDATLAIMVGGTRGLRAGEG